MTFKQKALSDSIQLNTKETSGGGQRKSGKQIEACYHDFPSSDVDNRGLEALSDGQRQERIRYAVRQIIKAQKKYKNTKFSLLDTSGEICYEIDNTTLLSILSRKLSKTARIRAFQHGKNDEMIANVINNS